MARTKNKSKKTYTTKQMIDRIKVCAKKGTSIPKNVITGTLDRVRKDNPNNRDKILSEIRKIINVAQIVNNKIRGRVSYTIFEYMCVNSNDVLEPEDQVLLIKSFCHDNIYLKSCIFDHKKTSETFMAHADRDLYRNMYITCLKPTRKKKTKNNINRFDASNYFSSDAKATKLFLSAIWLLKNDQDWILSETERLKGKLFVLEMLATISKSVSDANHSQAKAAKLNEKVETIDRDNEDEYEDFLEDLYGIDTMHFDDFMDMPLSDESDYFESELMSSLDINNWYYERDFLSNAHSVHMSEVKKTELINHRRSGYPYMHLYGTYTSHLFELFPKQFLTDTRETCKDALIKLFDDKIGDVNDKVQDTITSLVDFIVKRKIASFAYGFRMTNTNLVINNKNVSLDQIRKNIKGLRDEDHSIPSDIGDKLIQMMDFESDNNVKTDLSKAFIGSRSLVGPTLASMVIYILQGGTQFGTPQLTDFKVTLDFTIDGFDADSIG